MIAALPPTSTTNPAPRTASTTPQGMSAADAGGGIPGLWKYEGIGWSRLPFVIAVLLSIGMHVLFLFGFNEKKKVVKTVATEQVEMIQMSMPELEEEPTDKVEELSDAADEAPSVAVPQLADLPSAVSVTTFVQPLQFTPDVSANLSAAKVATIPVNVGRRNLASMGKIFEISQLDRAPTPIMQPAPVFPYSLKQTVSEARVLVEFIVDSNGDVVAPFVVNTSHAGFNENAIIGVLKWKFRPGMKAGKRVNTRVRAPINFFVSED